MSNSQCMWLECTLLSSGMFLCTLASYSSGTGAGDRCNHETRSSWPVLIIALFFIILAAVLRVTIVSKTAK